MKSIPLCVAAFAATAAQAITTGPYDYPPRDYPESCLASPLTNDAPRGPSFSRTTQMEVVDRATLAPRGIENAEFLFWRVPCDGGKSALMLRISHGNPLDRTRPLRFPNMPGLTVRQGSVVAMARLAREPNTAHSSVKAGDLIPYSATFVVENFHREDARFGGTVTPRASQGLLDPPIDFNAALEVFLPPEELSPPITLAIPAYDPAAHPTASAPMTITGYHAGGYYDPAHPNEGIIVDVMGYVAGPFGIIQRAITLAWFTFDQAGRPFWLHGTATINVEHSQAVVPLDFFSGGAFAGASGATPSRARWGTVTVSFPDCTSMRFAFASTPGLAAPVPTGSGERIWARLTQQSGLRCR